MVFSDKFLFIDTAKDAARTSAEYVVDGDSTTMTIQVGGGFSSVSLTVSGKTDSDGDYVNLAVIDLTDLSVSSNGAITKAGIYTLDVSGIKKIKITMNSHSGAVKVFGAASGV